MDKRNAKKQKIEQFSQAFAQLPDAILITDSNFNIVSINKAFEEMYGYTLEDLAGKRVDLLNVEPMAESIQQDIYDTVSRNNVWRGTALNRKKDGSTFWCDLTASALIDEHGKPFAYVGTQKDITKYKRAEETLRESEERYRGVVEDTPVLFCRFLPGGEITFVNKAYCEYFARTSEELVGSVFLSLIPESDRETVMANISALTVESPTQSHEHQVLVSGGEIRWQQWVNRALFDNRGKVVAYQSIGEDITERKQAEKKLKDSEENYKVTLENLQVGVVVHKGDGSVLFSNPEASHILGLTNKQMLGKELIDPSLELSS